MDIVSKSAKRIVLLLSVALVCGVVIAAAVHSGPAQAQIVAPQTTQEAHLQADCAGTIRRVGSDLGIYRYQTYSDGSAVVDVTGKFALVPFDARVQIAQAMQCVGSKGRMAAIQPTSNVVFQDYRTHKQLAAFDARTGLD